MKENCVVNNLAGRESLSRLDYIPHRSPFEITKSHVKVINEWIRSKSKTGKSQQAKGK